MSYSSALEKFSKVIDPECSFKTGDKTIRGEEPLSRKKEPTAEVSCQTDIQGVQTTLITQEEYERRYSMTPIPPTAYSVGSPYPFNFFTMPDMMRRFY